MSDLKPDPRLQLDSATNAAHYQQRIAPRVFHNVDRAADPTLIIVAGQPGAGKTNVRDAIKNELGAKGGVAVIDANALEKNHPHHAALSRRDENIASIHTRPDADVWTTKALEEARTRRYNVALETTLSNADKAVALVNQFKDAGYRVEVRALAVPQRDSDRGLRAQYEELKAIREPARLASPEQTAEAAKGLVDSLKRIEAETKVDRVSIIRRSDEVVYDNRQIDGRWQVTPPIADRALQLERDRPRTREELQQRTTELDRIEKLVSVRTTATAIEKSTIAAEVKAARAEFREHINKIPPPSRAEAQQQSLDAALKIAQKLGGQKAQLAGPLQGQSYKGPILAETKEHVVQGGPSLTTFIAHEKRRLAHTPPIGHMADVKYPLNKDQQASVTELRLPDAKKELDTPKPKAAEEDIEIER